MKTGQSRRASATEVLLNYLIGFWIGVATQEMVSSYYHLQLNLAANMQITFIFTVVSVIRSYVLRRFFNYLSLR